MGAILHTLNPRYSPDQLIYILNHAEDSVLIIDPTFIPLVESVQDKLDSVKTIIIASSKDAIPENNLNSPLSYEELINDCLLYTSPSPRDMRRSRMPSSA